MSIEKGREYNNISFKIQPKIKGFKTSFCGFPFRRNSGMTLFIALMKIRETMDADLSFDFVCRAGICGSCGMVVNGKPTLACRTLIANYPLENYN